MALLLYVAAFSSLLPFCCNHFALSPSCGIKRTIKWPCPLYFWTSECCCFASIQLLGCGLASLCCCVLFTAAFMLQLFYKHLAATSLPPHKANLLADTETARRSCSSVGIPPLEIAAPCWLARDSEDTLRVKRLPMCSFENDRLCGRAGPRTLRYDEHHDENRPSILASPLLALASKNSWT